MLAADADLEAFTNRPTALHADLDQFADAFTVDRHERVRREDAALGVDTQEARGIVARDAESRLCQIVRAERRTPPIAQSRPPGARAALLAGEIAQSAEFFSFGTNDLTQTTFGISRDDAASFLGIYTQCGILPSDPFVSIDREGVGELVRIGVERGRAVRKGLKVGICGEHGGDPASVEFCHETGLDYVSCSPFRVPIARLAAAQAALGRKAAGQA